MLGVSLLILLPGLTFEGVSNFGSGKINSSMWVFYHVVFTDLNWAGNVLLIFSIMVSSQSTPEAATFIAPGV